MSEQKIHLIGIGGVGMAGLALLLKQSGASVSGCDVQLGPRTRWLEAHGISVSCGHALAHLSEADLIVATPAAAQTEEFVRAQLSGRLRLRGEVLAELVSSRDSVAVCGSHGKTTTATWTAQLLRALGEDVAWCIGGETGDFPVAGCGEGPLVVEADESDGTLARYRARTLVVTNCEYDHPDHFKTVADYRACYDQAREQAANVIESEALPPLEELDALPAFAALPAHNRKNARAVVEVARQRGHALAAILQALPAIVARLPNRRFQKIVDGIYADYAHHPTELRCAVEMARQVADRTADGTRHQVRVLFQPHRYSRTKSLLTEFPPAFAGADEIVICPTYAAFERPIEGGSSADLYAAIRAARPVGCRAVYLAPSCSAAWEHARNSSQAGDVTLLLGAGDIIDLVPTIRTECANPSAIPPARRIFIGAGSNTWRSDLNLSVSYVRTSGPADQPGASLGIPWMVGIPGTIGGWIKMNAGAFGHSISEVLAEVKVNGVWRAATDCGFGYRTSTIEGEISDYRLDPARLAEAKASGTPEFYRQKRRNFPPGTYGSFFKNPPNDFAGRLLEAVGAKEMRVGGAYVWSEHANVIVRGPTATPSDVLALARLLQQRVHFRLGVTLQPEVQLNL